MIIAPFWEEITGPSLRQGDHFPGCLVPVFDLSFSVPGTHEVAADEYDLVLMTQSCDLEQQKIRLVAACPIFTLAEFEAVNPAFAKKGRWNEVLKGRTEGLHLLASPTNAADNRDALPFAYFATRSTQLSTRWRLRSPYLEHFSQAFARFFMRVGLPSTIPPFP
jgi:hypothetical protein